MAIKVTRVLLSLQPALLDAMDAKVAATGKSRSEFIRDAIRYHIKHGDHLEVTVPEQVEAAE